MKCCFTLFVFIILSFSVCAQNMVPNGDFEYYSTCPTGSNQLSVCDGWNNFTLGTVDYYNSCNTSFTSVPFNIYGYQFAASGQGYVGGYNWAGKEYIFRQILPLQIGVTYEVSFSVNLANISKYGSSDIGLFFYKNSGLGTPPIPTSGIPANVVPQITFSGYGPFLDTTNWIRVVQSFYADSSYDHIVIGGFKPLSNTDTIVVNNNGAGASYYYFDSVVVHVATAITLNINDSILCAGDTIKVPYTVNLLSYFNSNNIFSVQLSDANGSFASPVIIGNHVGNSNDTIICVIPSSISPGGNYKMRIVSSSPVDYSNITKAIGIGTAVAKPDATSNSPVCPNSSINLTASTATINTAIKWRWTGPGGFSSILQNPVISSASGSNTGDYIVTASLYGCMAKDTTNVSILSALGPAGAFAGSNSPACTNDTLKLFATTMYSGVTYQWTGPNSFSSTLQNPIISNLTFAASGDYIVDATYLNCLVKDTVSVSILTPSFTVSASGNNPVCNGGIFIMTSSGSASGISYTWSGPFGFSASGSNTNLSNITTANAGDYIVTGSFNGCSVKDTLTLAVNPLPTKPVASSNTPICSGNTLSLTSYTTTNGVSYSWTGPNSFTSSAQNPSITNTTTAASGDYIVTATITATGCAAKDTETVMVRPTPVVSATNNSPLCEGSALNISSTATPTGIISWTGPNSYTSSAQNPTITNANPNASGDYIISVTLNGCTGKDTTTVMVNPQPIIPLTGSNTPVCVGMNLNLTAASNTGASYSWTGPNGFISAAQNPTRNNIGIADAGTYSVIATLNGCSSIAGSTAVVVNPAPFVTIYSNPADSICQGSSVTFVALPANTSTPTYRWTKNSSPSVLGTSNTFISTTINNNDLIRCEITEIQKCGVPFTDTSNEIKMTVLSWVTPSVSITATPSAPLSPNQLISFTATPVNGGSKPQYQWTRNGTNVIGANAAGWSTQQLSNNDVICVSLTSSEKCPQPKTVQSNCITVTVLTDVNNIKTISNLTLYPNPNNGSFIIKGQVNSNKVMILQILNATGQLVYEARTLPKNKELYEQVDVQHLPGGLYMLRLNSKDNIRFIIER